MRIALQKFYKDVNEEMKRNSFVINISIITRITRIEKVKTSVESVGH